MDSIESAIGVLSAGEAADCSLALAYSRDVAPQDRLLWEAALAYFDTRAPERHWGYFGPWLSRTLEAGQPAELAVRRLLSRIEPCDRSIGLLENLGQIASEPRFKNLKPWCASHAGLWLELARGWSEQPACFSLFHCSHNLFLRLARIMSPLQSMRDRSDLSLQCLKAIGNPTYGGVRAGGREAPGYSLRPSLLEQRRQALADAHLLAPGLYTAVHAGGANLSPGVTPQDS